MTRKMHLSGKNEAQLGATFPQLDATFPQLGATFEILLFRAIFSSVGSEKRQFFVFSWSESDLETNFEQNRNKSEQNRNKNRIFRKSEQNRDRIATNRSMLGFQLF